MRLACGLSEAGDRAPEDWALASTSALPLLRPVFWEASRGRASCCRAGDAGHGGAALCLAGGWEGPRAGGGGPARWGRPNGAWHPHSSLSSDRPLPTASVSREKHRDPLGEPGPSSVRRISGGAAPFKVPPEQKALKKGGAENLVFIYLKKC